MTPRKKALRAHELLNKEYGVLPHVPRREPMHELISTMLSHRTTQNQEHIAFHKMWDTFGSWEAIMNAPVEELIESISGVRFPGMKAPRIQQVLKKIHDARGEFSIDFLKDLSAPKAMEWLMNLPGVGLKTASLVLLFCFKKAVLPVDTHVYRVSQRLGLIPLGMSAEEAHTELPKLISKKPADLYNFHKHFLWHGQRVCTWARPKHDKCILAGICNFYIQEAKGAKKGAKAVTKRA